jgi:hypothetical protein
LSRKINKNSKIYVGFFCQKNFEGKKRMKEGFYRIFIRFLKPDISLKKSKMVASTEINLKIISII